MSLSGFLVRKVQVRNPEIVDVPVWNVDGVVGFRWKRQARVTPCPAKVEISWKLLQNIFSHAVSVTVWSFVWKKWFRRPFKNFYTSCTLSSRSLACAHLCSGFSLVQYWPDALPGTTNDSYSDVRGSWIQVRWLKSIALTTETRPLLDRTIVRKVNFRTFKIRTSSLESADNVLGRLDNKCLNVWVIYVNCAHYVICTILYCSLFLLLS